MPTSWNPDSGARSALDFYRLVYRHSQRQLYELLVSELTDGDSRISFEHFKRRVLRGYDTNDDIKAAAARALKEDISTLFPNAKSPAVDASWSCNTRFWLSQVGSPLHGPDEVPFQNFKPGDLNRSPIESIWTELGEASLSVSRLDGGRKDLGDVLKVKYRCSGKATASYIGVHPQDRLPRSPLNQQWICFQARCTSKSKTEPVLTIRVSDRHHYQWQFAPSELRFRSLRPQATRYTNFYFRLDDHASWNLMWPPPHPPKRPDFTTITRIAIEFGFGSKLIASSKGSAEIEVKNLCLCSSDTFIPQLKANQKRSDFRLSPVSQ